MKWNEVTTTQIAGGILAVKDAMIMLGEDEERPETPFIQCEPGEYVFEINVPTPFHAHRARIRRVGSEPGHGREIGSVDIDHAFLGVIDYERFIGEVNKDYEDYEDWTATELDDELAINFSGAIAFKDARLLYVKSGDGDGSYTCIELLQDGVPVGIECVFIP